MLTAAVPGRSSLPLGSASSLGLGVSFFTNTGALRVFWELLVTNADALDRARAERVHQGARLAREQERASQQRIAHDSALQLLEAIAGVWDIDEERLLERIGNRNLVQLRLDPDLELPVFERVLAGDRERVFCDEAVWLPQQPEGPVVDRSACPDCGGTGDLRTAIGKLPDTRLSR